VLGVRSVRHPVYSDSAGILNIMSVLYSTINDGNGCKILNLEDVPALVKDKNVHENNVESHVQHPRMVCK